MSKVMMKFWFRRLFHCRGFCRQHLFPNPPCLGCPLGQAEEMDECERNMEKIYDKYVQRLGFRW